jgi:hypothetical protein
MQPSPAAATRAVCHLSSTFDTACTRVGEAQHRAAQHDTAHACMPQHTRSSGANHLVALRQPPVNVLHE